MKKKNIPASFYDFLVERIGAKWVVAVRTKRIVAKYGADTLVISHKRYADLHNEYLRLTA